MNKKTYKQPSMKVIELASSAILTGSLDFNNGIQPLPDDENEREGVIFE